MIPFSFDPRFAYLNCACGAIVPSVLFRRVSLIHIVVSSEGLIWAGSVFYQPGSVNGFTLCAIQGFLSEH